MAWHRLLQLIVGSSMMLAKTASAPPLPKTAARAKVMIDEILSYQCARSVATIVSASEQIGPLFAAGRLVFTSLEARDSSKLLLVNAGYGNFAIALSGDGVNRIRFTIPTSEKSGGQEFFLSYLHGGALRSRYFEFSEAEPPVGREDLDFISVEAQRADYLLPHLDYAIHETAKSTLDAITDGKLTRRNLNPHNVENCEHLDRQSPTVARNLRYNLDLLELMMVGPASARRMPASLGVPQPIRLKR